MVPYRLFQAKCAAFDGIGLFGRIVWMCSSSYRFCVTRDQLLDSKEYEDRSLGRTLTLEMMR